MIKVEIIDLINEYMLVELIVLNYKGEVVFRFCYLDGFGEIGVILFVFDVFCGLCNRVCFFVRGELFICLFVLSGFDFRGLVWQELSDDELLEMIGIVWKNWIDQYLVDCILLKVLDKKKVEMFYIGG